MYSKIFKWTAWILMIISVVILVWGFVTGFESNDGAAVDVLLRWGYIMVGLTVAAVLIATVVIGGINNPKGLVKGLIGLVLVAAVCFVVYAISKGEPLMGYIGEQPSQQTLKFTDTVLNLIYLLGGCAILSIVVGEVVSVIRNK